MSFLGRNAVVREQIQAIAQEWTRYIGITMEFGDDPAAEIRVGFENTGSWSYIGTDCLAQCKARRYRRSRPHVISTRRVLGSAGRQRRDDVVDGRPAMGHSVPHRRTR